MVKHNWHVYIWMVLLMLITATIGIRGLYADELYIDEAVSAIHVHYGGWHNPLEVMQSLQRNSPDHVPGYFTILMVWARLIAFDPGMLRYFSVIFGVLLLAMTYRLGTSLHSSTVGLLASMFVGLSGLFLYYTHELRMYTFLMTLITFEAWLYWKIIRHNKPVTGYHWISLTVGAVLLIYTHYFSIFVLAGLGLYHFLFVTKDRRWVGVALSMGIAGITLLPWLWVQRESLANQYTLGGAITSTEVVMYTGFLFTNGFPFLLLLIIPGMIIGIRHREKQLIFALTIVVGTMVSFVFVHQFVSSLIAYRRARYVLILWPYLAILSAISLLWLMRLRWLIVAFAIIWALTTGLYLTSSDLPLQTNRIDDMDVAWYPPIYRITQQLDGLATKDTPVWLVDLQNPTTSLKIPDRVWLFYSDWSGIPIRYLRDTAFDHDLQISGYDKETVSGVWFVHPLDLEYAQIETFLEEQFTVCDEHLDGDGYSISYYVLKHEQCTSLN
jgi:hypothetical protein